MKSIADLMHKDLGLNDTVADMNIFNFEFEFQNAICTHMDTCQAFTKLLSENV